MFASPLPFPATESAHLNTDTELAQLHLKAATHSHPSYHGNIVA